jgi:hypothetical protein
MAFGASDCQSAPKAMDPGKGDIERLERGTIMEIFFGSQITLGKDVALPLHVVPK